MNIEHILKYVQYRNVCPIQALNLLVLNSILNMDLVESWIQKNHNFNFKSPKFHLKKKLE